MCAQCTGRIVFCYCQSPAAFGSRGHRANCFFAIVRACQSWISGSPSVAIISTSRFLLITCSSALCGVDHEGRYLLFGRQSSQLRWQLPLEVTHRPIPSGELRGWRRNRGARRRITFLRLHHSQRGLLPARPRLSFSFLSRLHHSRRWILRARRNLNFSLLRHTLNWFVDIRT